MFEKGKPLHRRLAAAALPVPSERRKAPPRHGPGGHPCFPSYQEESEWPMLPLLPALWSEKHGLRLPSASQCAMRRDGAPVFLTEREHALANAAGKPSPARRRLTVPDPDESSEARRIFLASGHHNIEGLLRCHRRPLRPRSSSQLNPRYRRLTQRDLLTLRIGSVRG